MNPEVEKYRIQIFKYGILSLLFVLEHFEKEENYEECQNIIDAIRLQEERLDIKLFTVINEKTIQEVINSYKSFGLTGINAVENSQYYAELIIEELKNKQSCSFKVTGIGKPID